jgi:predicted O-methyltransferase YrrM
MPLAETLLRPGRGRHRAATGAVEARAHARLALRLLAAAPTLPPSVVRFHAAALRLAIARADAFTLRSAADPRQLAALLRLARGRRRIVELGTATGWTAAAFALADPARAVVSCDPVGQPGRDRYLRLLPPSALARIALVRATGVHTAAIADGPAIDLLFIDSSHERRATIDEWHAWRPRLAAGALVVFHDYDHPAFPGVAEAIDELGLVGRERDGMFVWEAPRDGWLPDLRQAVPE